MLNRFIRTESKGNLQLFTVPAPDKVENPAVITEPEQLSQWLAALPNANLKKVADQITVSLVHLNRFPTRLSNRLELIEQYRPYLSRLCRISPNDPQAPALPLLRQLMTETAHAYKHVINDQLHHSSWLKGRKSLLTGIYYATKFLSMELLLAYEHYDAKTANAWREILRLYRLAEQQNLHHEKVADDNQPHPEFATTSHLMKRVLLLSLLDPGQLQPHEARICYAYLNQLASSARLEASTAESDLAGRYVLDLEGTPRPPRLNDLEPDTIDPNRHRLLNLLPVSKQIQQDMRQIQLKEAEPPYGLQHLPHTEAVRILNRILKSWHVHNERQSERYNAYGWVHISIGISSIHNFLQGDPAGHSLSDFEQAADNDEAMVLGVDLPPQRHNHAQYDNLRCRLSNRSQTGIALHIPLPVTNEPKVGQVLLIQESHPEQQEILRIGIVRRCLRPETGTLELGVQYVPGEIKSATVRPITAAEMEPGFQPALMIHHPGNDTYSMLVSRGLFAESRQYIIAEGEPSDKVQAKNLIDSTPGFDWFNIGT